MKTGLIIVIVVIVILLLIGIFMVKNYNVLVQLRNRVKDQWSQISVQVKRRFDLIPNLVETVKGYAAHENETLKGVIEARNKYAVSKSKQDEMEANNMLTNAIGKLFALSEAYPELKANENFMNLQNELSETEDKIALTRQIYNDVVLTYNNKVEIFPSNIIAKMFNFEKEVFFEITEEESKNVKVEF